VNILVVCLFKRQAQILFELTSFEVDMAFKRVRDGDINEIVFASFLPELNKSKYNG
jgi:hypothetical protein